MCRVEYSKRYLDLLQHWRTRTFDTILYKISLVNLPITLAFCRYKLFLSNSKFRAMRKSIRDCHDARKTTCADGEKHYFDRNIWDMSIDITYFVLDILQVGISRSTYYISFERMCLTE